MGRKLRHSLCLATWPHTQNSWYNKPWNNYTHSHCLNLQYWQTFSVWYFVQLLDNVTRHSNNRSVYLYKPLIHQGLWFALRTSLSRKERKQDRHMLGSFMSSSLIWSDTVGNRTCKIICGLLPIRNKIWFCKQIKNVPQLKACVECVSVYLKITPKITFQNGERKVLQWLAFMELLQSSDWMKD